MRTCLSRIKPWITTQGNISHPKGWLGLLGPDVPWASTHLCWRWSQEFFVAGAALWSVGCWVHAWPLPSRLLSPGTPLPTCNIPNSSQSLPNANQSARWRHLENLWRGLMGFTAKAPERLSSHSPKRNKQLRLPELFLPKAHFFTTFLNLYLLSLLDC